MALEDAWLFLKADVDYDFGLTHRRQPTEEESYVQGANRFPEKPIAGGYNMATRDIKLNPAEIYRQLKRQNLKRIVSEPANLGLSEKWRHVFAEPKEKEIIQALRNISQHEAVHAAHRNLEGANWFEEDGSASKDNPVTYYDMEMVAHLLDYPYDTHTRMTRLRGHPDFYRFPREKQQYINNYLAQAEDNQSEDEAAAQQNYEFQYGR